METPEYTLRKTGTPLTRDFRIYISLGDKLVSPWHDIPLFANERDRVFNMIVEVPRWENVKLEVCFFHVSSSWCFGRKADNATDSERRIPDAPPARH